MSTPKRAWIFSDIHLGPARWPSSATAGAGRGVPLHRGGRGHADQAHPRGDVFDFLQSRIRRFRRGADPARLDAILSSPQSKVVVAGLTGLVERPWCEVTVLSGNHDPQMLLPPCARAFRDRHRAPRDHPADDDALLRGDERRPPSRDALADGAVVAHGDHGTAPTPSTDRPSRAVEGRP